MAHWTRKPEEVPGNHHFERRMVMTRAFQDTTSPAERNDLIACLYRAVAANDGLDYLQVFKADEDERVVWCIDDGSHVTWLLPSDY